MAFQTRFQSRGRERSCSTPPDQTDLGSVWNRPRKRKGNWWNNWIVCFNSLSGLIPSFGKWPLQDRSWVCSCCRCCCLSNHHRSLKRNWRCCWSSPPGPGEVCASFLLQEYAPWAPARKVVHYQMPARGPSVLCLCVFCTGPREKAALSVACHRGACWAVCCPGWYGGVLPWQPAAPQNSGSPRTGLEGTGMPAGINTRESICQAIKRQLDYISKS